MPLIATAAVLLVYIISSTLIPSQAFSLFQYDNKPEATGKGGGQQSEFIMASANSLRSYHRPSLGKGGATGEPINYVVRQGDTISAIASRYNVSPQTILWENNLSKNSIIRPGDNLTILPTDGVRHKVKRGESVSAIAYEYDVEPEVIVDENDLGANAFIKEGGWLVIPGGTPPARSKTPTYAAGNNTHSVQRASAASFVYPTSGKNWGYLHSVNAVDIANNCGTPVYAAASGQIEIAYTSGWHGGYGSYIKISHGNGAETLYAHLRSLYRTSGRVEQGEQIGIMGTKGNSTGCHLHFEIRGARNPFPGPTRWVKALTTE